MTRRATAADARAIAAVQLRAWWRGYQDIVDARHFAEEDEAQRAVRWTEILASGATETYVTEIAGAVRGFVSVGPSREDHAHPPAGTEGELYAMYVDPPAQGAGVGSALLAEAEHALRAAGHAGAVLRVLRDNGLARTFFERHGWTLVSGSETLHRWNVPQVLYRRPL